MNEKLLFASVICFSIFLSLTVNATSTDGNYVLVAYDVIGSGESTLTDVNYVAYMNVGEISQQFVSDANYNAGIGLYGSPSKGAPVAVFVPTPVPPTGGGGTIPIVERFDVFPLFVEPDLFVDVLPNEIVDLRFSVLNLVDYDLNLFVSSSCVGLDKCAVFCKANNLVMVGAKDVSEVVVSCRIPVDAVEGDVFKVDFVVSDSLRSKSVLVSVPIRKGSMVSPFDAFKLVGKSVWGLWDFPIFCFVKLPYCVFVVGDTPLDLFGLRILYIGLGFIVLCILIAIYVYRKVKH